MLPLAQWVMRGRGQAVALIFICLLVSALIWPVGLLAASTIALIGLRVGFKSSLELCFWALLPALALIKLGSYLPLIIVCLMPCLALILKRSQSWINVLLALSGFGLFLAIALQTSAQGLLNDYVSMVHKALSQMAEQAEDASAYQQLINTITTQFMAGMASLIVIVASFLALLLARYWQALLYNPKGLSQEFHKLRWPTVYLPLIAVGLLVLFGLGKTYIAWAWIILFPLLVTGIALFHAIAKQKQLKKHWYILFYVFVLMGDLAKVVVIALAVADSLADLRKKLAEQHTD